MSDIKILPQKIKMKQSIVAGIVGLTVIGLVSAWVLFGKKPIISLDLEKTKRIEISKITKGVKAQDRWLQQAEGELVTLKKKIEDQEQERKSLEEKVTQIQEVFLQNSTEEKTSSSDDVLAEEIMKLREEIELLKNSQSKPQPEQMQGIRKIKSTELKLDSGKGVDLEHYIPAGSFAPAVVTSGVDASVGVNSQSDPRPTLFRITGLAKSAANSGIIQNIDLTGCTVTGAASGDLSSERVFIRLLKMACSREDGKVFETQVQGYVAGIGKAGVRGQVVSREGDLLCKVF